MRVTRLLVPIALAGLMLAGCVNAKDNGGAAAPTTAADNGIKDLTAAEIVAKAAQATDGAGAYRVKGEIVQGAQRFTIDGQIKNKDLSGSVSSSQGNAKVMRIGSVVYLQADPALWGIFAGPAAETIATLFKGKWVKTSTASSQFAEFAIFGDVTKMVQTYGTSTISKGDLKTVNGVSVIELREASGMSIYVATVGEPYFVRVETMDRGELDLSEFGAKVDDLKAPPSDQVVDLSGLMALAG